MTGQGHTPAGWYPDPRDQRFVRYWDGARWTSYTQPRVPTPAGASVPPARAAAGVARTRARWRPWWLVVPALVLAAALVVIALVATPSDEDVAASSAKAIPSSSPAARVTPTPTPTPTMTTVPAVKGLSAARAQEKLRWADLEVGHVTRQPSSARPGTVLAQDLRKGVEVKPGTVVSLIIAMPFPRIPAVVGRTGASATAKLRQAGYAVKTVIRTQTSGRAGVVLDQSPRGGVRAKAGSLVTITVLKVVAPPPPPPSPQPKNCTPGYSPCLPPAYDYDCAGGSGDGPEYASGPVYIHGSDPYDLDADGDGVACEY